MSRNDESDDAAPSVAQRGLEARTPRLVAAILACCVMLSGADAAAQVPQRTFLWFAGFNSEQSAEDVARACRAARGRAPTSETDEWRCSTSTIGLALVELTRSGMTFAAGGARRAYSGRPVARAPTAWLRAQHRTVSRRYAQLAERFERDYGAPTPLLELRRTPDGEVAAVRELTDMLHAAGLYSQPGRYEDGWVDHPPLAWIAADGSVLVLSTNACTTCDEPPSFTTFGFDATATGPSLVVRVGRVPLAVVEPLRTVREWWCVCSSDRIDGAARCFDGEAACQAEERRLAAPAIACQPFGVARSPDGLFHGDRWADVAPLTFESSTGCGQLADFINAQGGDD